MTHFSNRRDFLRASLLGGLAAVGTPRLARLVHAADESTTLKPTSRVALFHGDDRADIAFRALKAHEQAVSRAIGNRRVVVKPNNVAIDKQLSATHAGCLEGILEFLKSIGKLQNTVIAESAANGPTLDGFENYHYTDLAKKYSVRLIDLDDQMNYCAQAGLGEGDLQKIQVVGEPIAKHIRRYKLADNIAQQLVWMTPPKPS
jgi:hypothetical protein